LQAAVEAQRAAGIMTVACAFNDGPSCYTVTYPPAIYDAAYTVGALINNTDFIAPFSSRGPVTIDGSNRIKPDITAPGTNVRSAVNTCDSCYNNFFGTSMATPHVSGAMALLWSAIPSLKNQLDSSRTAMNNAAHFIPSTQCGDAGPPNNVYGWGRVDIIAAVGGSPTPTPTPAPTPTPTPTQTPLPCSLVWQGRASVPYPAGGIFAVSDGTCVYVGGGADTANGIVHNDLLRYDPMKDSWTPLQSSLDYHALSQAVYFNGRIYNMGGHDEHFIYTDTTRIYDIATNTWSTGAPMPQALTLMATALWDGVVYVAGGFFNGQRVNTLYAYHIVSNTWETLAPMPQALARPGFGIINGKLYVAGGTNGAPLNTLYIYDIATNTWRLDNERHLPQAVDGPGSSVLNGLLYLYGGRLPGQILTNMTWIYDPDPASNTWSPGPNMNVARWGLYGTAFGSDSTVAPGGWDANVNGLNDNEQLINIPCGTPTPTPTATATATATASTTATPTPTSSVTPTLRASATPRPRPTPAPRP
jgi:N-acetylneuraminic acid mutarotase